MMVNGHMPKSILLVDDDDSVRRIAAYSLTRLGYGVIEAVDGHSALEILEECPDGIDLLFSDIRMPGLPGDQLAGIVSRRWPDLPVLLTSGHVRSGEVDFPVLCKPYSRSQLAHAIDERLASGDAGD